MAEKKWSRHQYRLGWNPEITQRDRAYLEKRAQSIAEQYTRVMSAQTSVSAKIFFKEQVRKRIKGEVDAGSSGNTGTGK